ncbi:MAG: hypothetical protein LiPW15_8 [Parcubacteria group bacterium LiPW_15]|nr:MAG: hypothetical protein LiPW15_8 [Parcubacteria group bacterium LiPW_15]
MPHSTFHILHSRHQGQAALSLIFLIGGIALLVAVTLSLVAINFLNSTFAFQSANKAMALATSGVEDALVQLNRNSSFSNIGGYMVPAGCTIGAADCATVLVTQSSPAANQATIVSTATSFASQRKIQVVVAIDPNTGQLDIVSWEVKAL